MQSVSFIQHHQHLNVSYRNVNEFNDETIVFIFIMAVYGSISLNYKKVACVFHAICQDYARYDYYVIMQSASFQLSHCS